MKDFKNLSIYEIYPSSFKDSNNDGYGDIDGIIEKLDYVKDLGFGGIWVNSMYASAHLDGNYDVTDFYKIDPRFGDLDSLKRLIDECHKRNLVYIHELIPGHASIYHPDFIESSKPYNNEMSDLFIWTNSPWSWYPDVACIRGCYDRSGSYVVNFFAHQAAINYGYNEIKYPEWQVSSNSKTAEKSISYLEKIMRFYLDLGVDGFRVDMADSLVKNDGTKKPETIKLWQKVRKDLKNDYPNYTLTSEWCSPNEALQAGFDSDFVLDHDDNFLHYLFRQRDKEGNNIPLLHVFDSKLFTKFKKDVTLRCDCASHYKGVLSLISGNHDTERLANFLTEEELRLAYLFLFTMPGVPYLYAGDEYGSKQDMKLNSVEGGYQRTGCRSPFRWNKDEKNAGFSDSDWTYIPTNSESSSVSEQINDQNSLLNLVKNLVDIRNRNPELSDDSFALIDKLYFAYQRKNFKVYINLKETDMVINLNTKPSFVFGVNNYTLTEDNKLIIKHHGGVLIRE